MDKNPNHNDLTFFTNEENHTLLDRFKTILKTVEFFDILVGYFRISGFHKLYDAFENIEKIRILVGLNVDKKTFSIIERDITDGKLDFETHSRTKEIIGKKLIEEIETSEDTQEIEKRKLEKFYLSNEKESIELDFLTAAKLFEATEKSKAHKLPSDFYKYLADNKAKIDADLSEDIIEQETTGRGGGRDNATRILKILKSGEIKRYDGFTDLDDEYLDKVRKLLEEGGMPKKTAKTIFNELKGEVNPMKILAIIKRNLPNQLFNSTQTAKDISMSSPKEVILSEYLLK